MSINICEKRAKKGLLFIISGPSGVGKKTIIDKLLQFKELNLNLSISFTTREKRDGEIEGKDYFFISKKQFKEEIENDNVLEYAEFFNNFYGTPKDFVLKNLNEGKNLLLEIEVIGFNQLALKFPELVSIFILPPSLEELKKRLLKRNTENIEKINMRLQKASEEIKEQSKFDYCFVNDNVDKVIEQIKTMIIEKIKSCC